MSDGISTVLVHPRVETGEIVVPDLFLAMGVMVQFDPIRAAAVEGVARSEWVLQGQPCDESGHVGVFTGSPLAFPHLDEVVPACLEESPFVVDELANVVHGPIQQPRMNLGALRMASTAPEPVAAVRLVRRVSLGCDVR